MLLTIFQTIQATKNRCFVLVFLCFFFSVITTAQNLITNGDFGTFNAGVTNPTQLGYQSNYNQIAYNAGNSSPRQYAITNNPRTVNTTNFQSLSDHTTSNGSGNMMVVDGDSNEIFWKQNPDRQLVGGQTYTFSFWIRNVNNVINGSSPAPVIRFNPQGCSVCSAQTKPVIGTAWQLFTFTITTATTQFVRIELSTVNAGGGGNDFAIDDVSLFAPPAPLTISNSLTNPSCPGISDGVIVAYPNGGVAPFSYTLSGSSSATNITGVFQGLAAGTYKVSVTDSNSPATTRTTPDIFVSNPLDITLSSSPTGCILSATPIKLTAANGGTTYSWSASTGIPISDTDDVANVSPLVTTIYTVSSTKVSPTTSVNLIGNPGFENGTSGFFSDYGYSLTNTSGTQFAYGIVVNPNSWFSGFVSSSDHTTGNGTGKMLVADGATVANSVIWSQTIPVETSKIYNFSFWAQNLVAASPAQFQVLINGTPITILPISATNGGSAGWTEIKGTWNSSGATIAIIKILDTNIASTGNDFAIDDITFSTTTSKSCNLSTDLTVNIGGSAPITNFSFASPFCKNSTNPSPTGAIGFVTGGTYTDDNATGLLLINASTGVINLSASTSGTYTIKYSVAANPGVCQSAGSSTFDITINALPTIATTTNNNRCGTGTVTLGATASAGLINWYTAPAGGPSLGIGTSFVTPSIASNTTYYVDATSGNCTTAARTAVLATVNTIPTITGTTPNNICGTGKVTLGATASAGTINWYAAPAGGPSLGTGTSFVTPSIASNTTYYVDATLGTCSTASRTAVLATVNTIPTITGTTPNNRCGTGTVTLGVTASVGTINWYAAASGGVSLVTGTAFVTPSIASNTTYYVDATLGTCTTASRTAVLATVNTIPIITSTTPNNRCGTGTVTLGAKSSTGTINWYAAAAGGVSLGTGGSFVTPSIASNTTYYVDATVGTCITGSRTAIIATINPILTPSFIGCGATTTSVQFTWLAVAGATGYDVSYKVNALPAVNVGAIGNVLTYPVPALTAGDSVIITVTPTGGSCFVSNTQTCSASSCVPPTITSTTFNNICGTGTVTLGATASSGTINWYAAAAGGVSLGTGTSFVTPSIISNTTYYVDATLGTCTTASRTAVIATVNTIPTISGTISVCNGLTTTLTGSGTPDGTAPWTSAPSSVATVNNLGVVSGISAGTSLITYKNSNGCIATQTITVNATPILTINCGTATGNSVTFNWNSITDATSYSYSYSINSGTAVPGVLSAATTSFTVNGLSPGQNVEITIAPTGSLCGKQAISNCVSSNCPTPIVDVISDFPSCANDNVAMPIFTSVTSGVTFNWTNNNTSIGIAASGSGATIPTFNVINTTAILQTATISVTANDGTCTGPAMIFNLDVNPLPTVTMSATQNAVCSGSGTTINFNGTPNTTVTYTVDSGINQFLVLDSSGNATLSTGNLTTNTIYSLVSVLNPITNCSQTQSGTAAISINALPTVTISGTTAVCSGSRTPISFNGTPNAIVTYTVNSGVNQTILLDVFGQATLPSGNLIANSDYSLVSIVDSNSCSQIQTGNATISVDALPTVTISGTGLICSGTATSINFNGTPNATVTYTVNSGTNQIIVLDSIGIATLPTGNLTSNTIYSLVSVSDKTTTCSQLQTGTATISINAAPDVVPATITQSVCSGQSSGVLLTSTTSGTIFNWTVIESDVTGATLGTGNNISQVLNTTSPINIGTAEYTVTPTANGCSGLPVVITVSVSPMPTAVATPDKDIICSGETTAIALSSGNTQTTFSWNAIQNNVTGATQDSGNTIAQVLQTSINNFGEAVYAITPSLNGCIGSTILVSITVNPVPIVSTNVFNNPICSGTATNIDLTSNVPGTTYSWSVAQTNVIGAVSGTGNAIAQIIETTGNSLGIAGYTITPQINSCIGNPIIVPIQVNPSPEVFGPSSTTICSGESTKISLIPLIIGTSFTWTHLSNKVTGASDGNGDEIDQILVAENSLGKVEYTVTPSFRDCSGTPILITVDVNPAPSVILESGVLCLEVDGTLKNSLILDTNLSTNSYDFEWFFNNSISTISGAIGSTFEAKELGDYHVNVRFKSTGCSIKSNTSTVTEVNPTNSFNVIVSDAFTEVATITVTGQNGITTYLYQIDDGALQTSNVFSGIGAGNYTIRITDSDGCTDYSEDVLVIDYPKYFTPNGDGFNDTWNIKGLRNQTNATLFIFDRYGKLLKQISPKGQGWDGTYNGVQLPATDYWFTVDYVEPNNDLNKLFKAHFSLKR